LLAVLKNPAYHFKRIGLEAGPLSQAKSVARELNYRRKSGHVELIVKAYRDDGTSVIG
jgi:hypothetical protein